MNVFARRSRVTSVAIVVAGVLAVSGVASTAALGYDRSRSERLLPGTSVGGVPVGTLAVADARQAVLRTWEEPLDEPLSLRVGDHHVETVTRRELGAMTDAVASFQETVRSQQQTRLHRRLWHRVTGRPVAHELEVTRYVDADKLDAYLARLADHVAVPATDAGVDVSSGFVQLSRERPGSKLNVEEARAALHDALASGAVPEPLPVESVAPARTRAGFGSVLLIRVGENKLYHYEGERLVKVYDVATGRASNPTPKGRFTLINKRRNPTWVNPARDRWGANMPARIGPGPNNPLGTRALDIDSPGIRIHGTSDSGSIGYNASQGCIRMRRADVEELFELVGVGTPVVIIQAGENRPRPGGTVASDEPAAEDDATPVG